MPTTAFYRKRKRLQPKCKKCQKAYHAEWYARNKEQVRANVRDYKADNAESIAQYRSAYGKRNRGKLSAARAKRRAAQLRATPVWADQDRIEAVYGQARQMSWEEGVDYHVDHVVPLRGELVSGLHVHENLEIITAAENCSKGNKYDVDH